MRNGLRRIQSSDEGSQLTLPDPTGPMTQIRSPGWAAKTIFFSVNDSFYSVESIHLTWERFIIDTLLYSIELPSGGTLPEWSSDQWWVGRAVALTRITIDRLGRIHRAREMPTDEVLFSYWNNVRHGPEYVCELSDNAKDHWYHSQKIGQCKFAWSQACRRQLRKNRRQILGPVPT